MDTYENANSVTLDISDVPIDLLDDGVTVESDSWSQARNNGKIAVKTTSIKGGRYDPVKSDPENKNYVGAYEHFLISESLGMYPEQTGFNDWIADKMQDDMLWEEGDTVYEGLTPDTYIVYIRDALDKTNADNIAHETLVVGDNAIDFDADTKRDGNDFNIDVLATGGRQGIRLYEFALLPVETLGAPLVPIQDMEAYGSEWTIGELPINDNKIYDELTAGVYQVGVRELAVKETDKQVLTDLQVALGIARYNLKSAQDGASVTGIEKAVLEYVQKVYYSYYDWFENLSADAELEYLELIHYDEDILAKLVAWEEAERGADELAILLTQAEYDQALKNLARSILTPIAESKLSDMENAFNVAESAYNNKLLELSTLSSAIYGSNSDLWNNAKTDFAEALSTSGMVRINITTTPVVGPRGASGTDFNIEVNGANLSATDLLQIHIDNRNYGLVAHSNGQYSWGGTLPSTIPVGSNFTFQVYLNGNSVDFTTVDVILNGKRLISGKRNGSVNILMFKHTAFGNVTES
jgi:hypothetical protein